MSPLTDEQIETLSVVHEVLRGLVVALTATLPSQSRPEFASALAAIAEDPSISPVAAHALLDLAGGVTAVVQAPDVAQ
jgi:hypothetical protein